MPKSSKVDKRARVMQILDGIKTRLDARKKHKVGGVPYTRGALAEVFQEHLDALDAVDRARIALAQAVAHERRIDRRVTRLVRALKAAVVVELGETDGFPAFGWELPKKPGPKTVEAKVRMVRKARATRAARKARRA